MFHQSSADNLAHASIPVPRGMVHPRASRLDIYLRETRNGHYRWFHADGAPTPIESASVHQAVEVAQTVWRDLRMLQQAPHELHA